MNKTAIIAIAVVVILIGAGTGVLIYNMNKNDDKKETLVNRLVVYGNANNDNYLDSDDLNFIKKIANGDEWDKTKNPYADANYDGKVDQDDVDVVQKFLNGEKATMYYTDWDLEVRHVGFPIKGNIATSYSIGLDIAIIGGFYSQMTRLLKVQSYVDSLDPTAYPNPDNQISSFFGKTKYDFDSVKAADLNLLMGDGYCYDATVIGQLEDAEKLGMETYILKLPVARVVNGMDINTTIITAGVMTMHQDATKDYIEYLDSIDRELYDKVKSDSSTVSEKKYFYLYKVNGNKITPRTLNSTGVHHSAPANLSMLPLDNVLPADANSGTDVTLDNIISYDPEYILCINTEWVISNQTDEQFKANVKTLFDSVSNTNAFKNGKIFYVGYELVGGAQYLPTLLLIGSMIWPDVFDSDYAWEKLQYFYDHFTNMDVDVKNSHLAPVTKADIYG